MDQINDSQVRWFIGLMVVILMIVIVVCVCLVVRNLDRTSPSMSIIEYDNDHDMV